VPEEVLNCPDNQTAKRIIEQIGKERSSAGKEFTLNPISGIPGSFYTDSRLRDLKQVCQEIINERNSQV
jgi:hypothetical protein